MADHAPRFVLDELRAKVEKEAARDFGPAVTPTQVGFDAGRRNAFDEVLALLDEEARRHG